MSVAGVRVVEFGTKPTFNLRIGSVLALERKVGVYGHKQCVYS